MKNVMKNIDIPAKLIKIGGISGGAYGAVKLNKIEWLSKQTPLVRGALKAVAGAFLPDLLKMVMKGKGGKKGDIITKVVEEASNGMIAIGGLEMAQSVDATLPALGDLSTMGDGGQVIFDEGYTNGVGKTETMGNTDDDVVVYD